LPGLTPADGDACQRLNIVSRARHVPKAGDEALSDALRNRLPRNVADEVEAFRRRAAMSPETLAELEELWAKSEMEGGTMRRAQETSNYLSGRAKRELERYQRELRRLSPTVMAQLKIGIARAARGADAAGVGRGRGPGRRCVVVATKGVDDRRHPREFGEILRHLTCSFTLAFMMQAFTLAEPLSARTAPASLTLIQTTSHH
jgi:hypothetical protein